MRLVLVLVAVSLFSFCIVRAIRREAPRSTSHRRSALVALGLFVVTALPTLWVVYIVLGLVEHALGS